MSSRPLRNLDLLGGGDEFNVTAHTKEGQQVEIRYIRETAVGNGSFGVVYKARITESNEVVAIKKVLQDRRFKNRELQIMKLVSHPNIVDLKYFFYTNGFKKSEVYLNLILEFVPETIYRASRASSRNFTSIPEVLVKLYTYQLFRALIYIHSMGICHRDIKPQNLLLDSERGIVKLCDFGSAKVLTPGEVNVAYICSRYYRAPELVFGATAYTTSIDIWSTGCVMAELMRGAPLFAGETGIDQLIEIIKVIGTPTSEQVRSMNPSYMEHRFPQIKPKELPSVLRYDLLPSGVDLLERILVYNPAERITAVDALVHPYFDELREPNTKLPTGAPLPQLFNFTAGELSVKPELIPKMVPPHLAPDLSQSLGLADLSQFKPIPSEQLRIPSLG